MGSPVKICPICGYHNPVDAIFCENEDCENDLSLVEPRDPDATAAKPATPPDQPAAAPEAVPAPVRPRSAAPGPVPPQVMQAGRQCRGCTFVSPLNTMVCPQCGASLASAPIVRREPPQAPAAAPEQTAVTWMIVSCDHEARLHIEEGQHLLIGWAGELGDYLERARKDYVSNRHGTLSVIRGELFFEDSSSNGTLINDQPIPKGQARKLAAGDILCLGGRPGVQMAQAAYFRVDRG